VLEDIKRLSEVLYVSTFPPRACGIATFTRDLTQAMNKRFNPVLKARILAMNDEKSIYNYDSDVRFQLNDADVEAYINTAKDINKSKRIQLVNIQHEFGLFGGEYGGYLIPFLEALEKPVVTTFHTILPNPDEDRKRIVKAIAKRSSAIVVIINDGIRILRKDYGIKKKIYVIPHGIPDVAFGLNEESKKKLRLEERIIISTYGLLSRGKGVEYIIKALPALVKRYPNLLYLVLGETHPRVRQYEGERYRNKLMKLTEELGLNDNVKFYNKYMELNELIDYLCATDVYVSASIDKNQISSGTIPYAMGCGKAVIATPSLYAIENLSNDKGVLVKFRDPRSITEAIDKILSDNEYKNKLEVNAYEHTRRMTWHNVAAAYLRVFNNVVKLRTEVVRKFPKIKMDHLRRLTDDFGIIQHAKYSNYREESGYTLDDNARALIVATKLNALTGNGIELVNVYLNFIRFAQESNGKFHNFVSFNREFLDDEGTHPPFGRALWALGVLVNSNIDEELKEKASTMLIKAIDNLKGLRSPRSKAFSIMGLYHYYKVYPEKAILEDIQELADSLVENFRNESTDDWKWFERYLTYSNGKLSGALFLAYEVTKDKRYLEIAKETLDFLTSLVLIDNKLVLIGHDGWYNYNGRRAFYDQQPVDAMSMVNAYLTAYIVTKDKSYHNKAVLSFNWFLGNNAINQMVYNPSSGGCFDGLRKGSVNLNQGAESTLSYLLARLSLEEVKRLDL
jgi:glycosyltransferase involved in cell wall biosynthesis